MTVSRSSCPPVPDGTRKYGIGGVDVTDAVMMSPSLRHIGDGYELLRLPRSRSRPVTISVPVAICTPLSRMLHVTSQVMSGMPAVKARNSMRSSVPSPPTRMPVVTASRGSVGDGSVMMDRPPVDGCVGQPGFGLSPELPHTRTLPAARLALRARDG